ncbi:hypothetical protein H4R18_000540 [Coemansia javaensis]|uniref:Uncharacterized protein n=1 Tax=Coemansia javaensis TaxID=2761396 RepID=A0A9W8LMP5_9FUNG|nr:hypothetical protein H4R18_000540 [Coemansia javaensis]
MAAAAAVRGGCGPRGLHQTAGAGQSFLGNLFGRKKTPAPAAEATEAQAEAQAQAAEPAEPADGGAAADHQARALGGRKATTTTARGPIHLKFPKRQFTPERLEARLKRVLREADVALAEPDWTATSIAERETKFRVLSGVIRHMKMPVSSRVLQNVQTAGDLLAELSLKPPSKDAGHPVAQFYAEKAESLPANMRFEPFAKGTRKLHAHQ